MGRNVLLSAASVVSTAPGPIPSPSSHIVGLALLGLLIALSSVAGQFYPFNSDVAQVERGR